MANNTGAIKAGRAYVEIYGDNSLFLKALKSTQTAALGVAAAVAQTSAAIGGVVAAIGTPLGLASASFANFGSALVDASARTGASVEALSMFQYAASQTGATLEDVEAAFKGLAKSGRFAGMSADNAMREALRTIGQISDPMERSRVAMDLFGKSGIALIPMAADMSALEKSARGLGIIMSTESASAADALGDAWGDLMTAGQAVVNLIGESLAPVLIEAIDLVTDFASVLLNGGILEAGNLVWSGLSAVWAEGISFIATSTKDGLISAAGFMIDVFSTIQTAWVETTEFMAKMWNKATNKIASGIIEIMGWFDKTLDVADAQTNLDEDTAGRQAEFDKRRAERLKAVQDSANQWKQGASDTLEGFAGTAAEQAQAEMDKFKRSINAVRSSRKEGTDRKKVIPGAELGDNFSAVGTFSGQLAGGLGAGNRLDEIATASKATAVNTKKIANNKGGIPVK